MKQSYLLRIIRQSSSQVINRSISKPKAVKLVSTPKSAPRIAFNRMHKSQSSDEGTNEDTHQSNSRSDGFFHHPRYHYIRRAILISPALLLAYLHLPYEIWPVNGQSMAPFLNANSSDGLPTTDRLLTKKWVSAEQHNKDGSMPKGAKSAEFERGQIVIFPTPHQPEKIAVKRIVAVPGDVVQPLPGYSGGDEPVVIPWNHVWVEGDAGSRSESMDSNWYGPISQNLIRGEVTAVITTWFKWNWIDWKQHSWPAREKGRVDEDAMTDATVDPDAVEYANAWRNGSVALLLENIKTHPESTIRQFWVDAKARQEIRRMYNHALYISNVGKSEQEKNLAQELLEEMETIYGREALVYGIKPKLQSRDRGDLPNANNSKIGARMRRTDAAAADAEDCLKKHGWELERNSDGSVRMNSS